MTYTYFWYEIFILKSIEFTKFNIIYLIYEAASEKIQSWEYYIWDVVIKALYLEKLIKFFTVSEPWKSTWSETSLNALLSFSKDAYLSQVWHYLCSTWCFQQNFVNLWSVAYCDSVQLCRTIEPNHSYIIS